MRICFQMTALIFLSAAAPAGLIATQIFFFSFGLFVVEKTFQYFHLVLEHLPRSFCDWQHAAGLISPTASAPASPEPAAPATAVAAASRASLILFGTGFIDGDGVSQKAAAIEFLNGILSFLFSFHLYKTEPSIQPGVLILDEGNGYDLSYFGKIGFQVFFRDFNGQISHV
jgi:hypothetical protein